MKPIVTIVTPTYNRAEQLKDLYASLLSQRKKVFQWFIVDDGSTDYTKKIVDHFINDAPFEIRYIFQQNRGKHVALNNAIQQISTRYTFIVDSDDTLTPDAIQNFYNDEPLISDKEDICGVGYLRGYSQKNVIGDMYPIDYEISDFITVRINQNIKGDKAEIWKTEDLKACPFAEIEGEKFLGEGYVWFQLALKKKMLFVNKIIYLTEYLEGGLTKSGRMLRVKCPIGGMMNANIMMHKPFNLKNRIKGTLLYVVYARFARKSFSSMVRETKEYTLIFVGYIPGSIIYFLWKEKYGK